MPTDSGATDVNGAAAQLSALIHSEQSLPTEEEQVEEHEARAQEQEAEPELDAESQETQAEASDTEENKYKVKVDGEELEVTLEELQKGFMMEANYRNKTTALNKERAAVESKAEEIDKQLEEARSLIDGDIEALDSQEMLELKETDPDEYIRKYDKIQDKIKKFQTLQERRASEQKARQDKLIQKEREALFDAFPEWKNDQQKMASESADLMKAMENLGFTQDELANVTDHRMFVLAHKAQQLEKIQKANLESKKAQPKPKSVKPGQPKTPEDRQMNKTKDAWAKLKKTGKRRDAERLLSMQEQ